MTPIDVHVEVGGTTVAAGQLFSTLRRGRLSSTFAYAAEYLRRHDGYALEPTLPLSAGSWKILAEVADATRDWPAAARRNGVPASELARFRPTLEATIRVVAEAAG